MSCGSATPTAPPRPRSWPSTTRRAGSRRRSTATGSTGSGRPRPAPTWRRSSPTCPAARTGARASAYASADRPAVGQDRPRGGRPYPDAAVRPPAVRGRPSAVHRQAPPAHHWFGALPVLIRCCSSAVLVVLVIAHLPLILIGGRVWAVLSRTGAGAGATNAPISAAGDRLPVPPQRGWSAAQA